MDQMEDDIFGSCKKEWKSTIFKETGFVMNLFEMKITNPNIFIYAIRIPVQSLIFQILTDCFTLQGFSMQSTDSFYIGLSSIIFCEIEGDQSTTYTNPTSLSMQFVYLFDILDID